MSFCLCIQWTWLNSNSEASAVFLGLSELLAVLLAHGQFRSQLETWAVSTQTLSLPLCGFLLSGISPPLSISCCFNCLLFISLVRQGLPTQGYGSGLTRHQVLRLMAVQSQSHVLRASGRIPDTIQGLQGTEACHLGIGRKCCPQNKKGSLARGPLRTMGAEWGRELGVRPFIAFLILSNVKAAHDINSRPCITLWLCWNPSTTSWLSKPIHLQVSKFISSYRTGC